MPNGFTDKSVKTLFSYVQNAAFTKFEIDFKKKPFGLKIVINATSYSFSWVLRLENPFKQFVNCTSHQFHEFSHDYQRPKYLS